jgi:SnoaL-like domain
MSPEDTEVVRCAVGAHDGEEWADGLQDALSAVDLDDPESVAAFVANDPGFRATHREIVVDISVLGAAPPVYRGHSEMLGFWLDWGGTWERYVYRVLEYRDLGDWVLTPIELEGRGRGGIPVSMTVFQLWHVRDGKVDVLRVFPSEDDAVEAARSA